MLGRDLPRQASATTPPDPRQEARVIRGVQRALIAAVDSYGTLSPNALDSTFHWGRDLGDLGTVMPTDGFVALLEGQARSNWCRRSYDLRRGGAVLRHCRCHG